MKILSPVSRVDETERLVQAGAEELYCGLLPSDWPYVALSINRRQEPEANFQSFDELKMCADIAHTHGVPLFLTLNEHYYIDKQYPYILNYVRQALDAGVDAFFISDITLLLAFHEGKIRFQKPLSCHLFPIKTKNYKEFSGIHYEQWQICKPGRECGRKENLPVLRRVPQRRDYSAISMTQTVTCRVNLPHAVR